MDERGEEKWEKVKGRRNGWGDADGFYGCGIYLPHYPKDPFEHASEQF